MFRISYPLHNGVVAGVGGWGGGWGIISVRPVLNNVGPQLKV